MPIHHDEDFPTAFAVLVAGMLVPALAVAAGRELLKLYVSSLQFVTIAAIAFGLFAWILIERLDIDRTSFGLVAVAWPWPVLLAALFSFLLLHRDQPFPRGPVAEVFRFLIGDVEGFFRYGALFALAGVAAVVASKAVEARAAHDDRVPDGRVIATGLGLATVTVVVIAVGANLAAANAASVTAIEPGTDTYERPTLEVTLDGVPAELRLTAVAPDGSSVTQRLTRADGRETPVRVAIPVQAERPPSHGTLPALAGTYRVRVAALSGVTVDTATFTATSGTNISLVGAQVVSGTPTWDDPPDRVVGTARHDTTVGVLVENGGSFHTPVSIALATPDDPRRVAFRDLTIAPGERLGVVLSIPADTVESIRSESDGSATIRIYVSDPYGDPVTSVEVELPSA
jgi:hypothetical protein